ncbi:MAG: hypothetical protein ACRDYE_10080 [Acidimicrobiales bacterium]
MQDQLVGPKHTVSFAHVRRNAVNHFKYPGVLVYLHGAIFV